MEPMVCAVPVLSAGRWNKRDRLRGRRWRQHLEALFSEKAGFSHTDGDLLQGALPKLRSIPRCDGKVSGGLGNKQVTNMLQKHYIGVNKKWVKTDAKTVDSVVIQNGGIPYHRYYG